LIELLIVVAVIAILAGMLLPALVKSKARAQAIYCMNNSKQLAFAWTLYAGDNNDQLVYNLGGAADRSTFAPSDAPDWVNNIMDWTLNPPNTNTAFVNTSLLGQYAGYSSSIFKCPADKALSDAQKGAGWAARVRSVSMNAMIGNPGDLLQSGTNVNNPNYRQFLKQADIPAPSSIFVFLDEHPDSINDGYFLIRPYGDDTNYDDKEWVDLPASYHNGAGSFSFSDGHTEIHHWVSPTTLCPNEPGGANLPIELRSNDRVDFYWVLHRSSVYQ
jgi:type II secretory pathway pseudopilin PulG